MSLLNRFGRPMRAVMIAVLLSATAAPIAVTPAVAAGLFGGGDDTAQRDTAQLTLRIQDLEQQVRDLTGQVQGLQFQLTQLQTLIDRNSQDADFRFKQLEGGKPSRSSSNSGDQGEATPEQTAPAQLAPAGKPARGAATAVASAGDDQTAGDGQQTDDGLGGSLDPLVGRGKPGASPGSDEVPLGPATGDATTYNPATPHPTGPGMPVLKQASTGAAAQAPAAQAAAAQNPAAQAQYKTAYAAIVKGDYPTATTQFKAFIKQYPTDPQAADATNWLGEALLQQQDYVDAADTLVTGYKAYPNSPRAPDMLLKLGIALAGAQQQDAACKTFGLLSTKYPNTTTAFKTRLKQEMARGKCPA